MKKEVEVILCIDKVDSMSFDELIESVQPVIDSDVWKAVRCSLAYEKFGKGGFMREDLDEKLGWKREDIKEIKYNNITDMGGSPAVKPNQYRMKIVAYLEKNEN